LRRVHLRFGPGSETGPEESKERGEQKQEWFHGGLKAFFEVADAVADLEEL